MIDAIASVFRTLNAQLLYRQGLINVALKGSYLLSVYFFKQWTKKMRPAQLRVIDNYDRDLKIQVDVSKTMGASMYWTGFHEFNEMRFLNRYLKDDMIFVDVGANQGEFSLFASKRLSKGKVLAFEPMSLFFDRLSFNVKLNGVKNIKCFKFGLSDRRATLPIYFNAGNALNHEGLASLFSINKADQTHEVISLEVFDDVVSHEFIPRIDFIKIDVEGSEWAVLKGCARSLRKDKPALMVELNNETAAMAGYDVSDMISWLKEFGYEPFQILRDRLEPMKIRPAFCNAVFLSR